jgi:site-specific DNA-methyltransferase (adenine-specific)
MPEINLFNEDCMEGMKRYPDKYFELAIVDPPYGVGQHFNFRYGIGDSVYENRKPLKEYWVELFRISTNQIVWGGNYFTDNLPVNRCWVSWYKGNPIDAFSDFELAWTSFDKVCSAISLESYGFNHSDKKTTGEKTIHPTQKPIQLYKWLLTKYAKPNDKILDTHLGSGSIAIACYDMGFDLTGFEIDKDYFEAMTKRFEKHKQQLTLTL